VSPSRNRNGAATFTCDDDHETQKRPIMIDRDYQSKLDELDRLLNDPDVAMEPSRVWSLLAEVSQHDTAPPERHAG
jgi:hypothetical protein